MKPHCASLGALLFLVTTAALCSGGDLGCSNGDGQRGSSGGGTSSDAMADAECQARTTGCISCCQRIYPAGVARLVNYVQACDCGDAGGCQSACASEYCLNATYTQGDGCNACIKDSIASEDGGVGPCYHAVISICQNDAQCSAYLTCTSPQQGTCSP